MSHSFLSLVDVCDNFRVSKADEELASFCLTNDVRTVVGLLRPNVVTALQADNQRAISLGHEPSWTFVVEDAGNGDDRCARCIHFALHLDNSRARSTAIQALCLRWHVEGIFADVIGGRLWRKELYPVYTNPFGPHNSANTAFEMERAACALFGVVTYGVHLTMYYLPSEADDRDQLRIWVPRRSRAKQTWPGFLDNTVAGGITAGISPFETLVKEAMEEASFPEYVIRNNAQSTGAVSYFYRTAKGYLQPEVQYVYDLCVPPSNSGTDLEIFLPKPLDGEVEAFELLTIRDVIQRMHAGLFKPNCALVLIDFLLRHGYITAESEPHYLDIISRLHGRFEIEKW